MPTHQYILTGALCALVAATGACKEEGPTKLFEEKGAWSLDKFDIGEGIENLDLQEREDQFLLYFDPETEIVAAATCIDSMGNMEISESLCDIQEFTCRCFNYTFEESQMTWIEFTPEVKASGAGTWVTPPDPPDPADEDGGGPKPGEPFGITLEAYPESNNTWRYSGLPFGLFSSNGVSSRYVFQVRGETAFTATGCLEVCGATTAAPPEM